MLDKKVNVIGQIIFLFLSVVLIVFAHLNLLSIVIAKFVSVLFIRIVLKEKFYKDNTELVNVDNTSYHDLEILRTIYPNATKMGLTSVGAILVTKSSIFIGSLYLSLVEIASFGVSVQIMGVISGLSLIYLSTNIPKIVSLRVENDYIAIQKLFIKSSLIMLLSYVIGLCLIIFIAPTFLQILGSKSQLLSSNLLLLLGISSLVDTYVGLTATILLTKNYVPFFKASILSGVLIVLGLIIAFKFIDVSILNLILVPFFVTVSYQGWKWPYVLIKDLYFEHIKHVESN